MELRNFRIGTPLALGFGIVLTMLIVMTVLGHLMNANSRDNLIEGMRTANAKQVLANTMRAALLESAVEMRNISLQQDVYLMQAYEDRAKNQRKRYEDARTNDAQAARQDVKDSPNDTTLLTARVTYNLSKRTAWYTTVGHVSNSGTAVLAVDAAGPVGAGMSQSGIMAGVRHFFCCRTVRWFHAVTSNASRIRSRIQRWPGMPAWRA